MTSIAPVSLNNIETQWRCICARHILFVEVTLSATKCESFIFSKIIFTSITRMFTYSVSILMQCMHL